MTTDLGLEAEDEAKDAKKRSNEMFESMNPSLPPRDEIDVDDMDFTASEFCGALGEVLPYEEAEDYLRMLAWRAKEAVEILHEAEETLANLQAAQAEIRVLQEKTSKQQNKLEKVEEKVKNVKTQRIAVEDEIKATQRKAKAVKTKLEPRSGTSPCDEELEGDGGWVSGSGMHQRVCGESRLQAARSDLAAVNTKLRREREELREQNVRLKSLRVELQQTRLSLSKALAQFVDKVASKRGDTVGRAFIAEQLREVIGDEESRSLLSSFDPSGGERLSGKSLTAWLTEGNFGGDEGELAVESDEYDTPPPGPDPDSDFGDILAPDPEVDVSKPAVRIFLDDKVGPAFLEAALAECQDWLLNKDKNLKAYKYKMRNPEVTLNFMSEDHTKAKVSIRYDHDSSGGMKDVSFSKFTLKREAGGSWEAAAMNFKGGSRRKWAMPEVDVHMEFTVGALKSAIATKFEISRESMLLYSTKGQLFDDGKFLKEAGVGFGEVVRVTSGAKPPLELGSAAHLKELSEKFHFQGYIEKTEMRGITLQQLEFVVDFLKGKSGVWRDSNKYSKTCGWTLEADTINLYHVNSWVIPPATKEKNCALVELLAGNDQIPKTFISHWWGEPVVDFILCVAEHHRVRALGDGDAYWVCAYANRQHDLGAELTLDPRETSFYKAMSLADGVLLILDSRNEMLDTGPATPFTRVWCCFEESVAVGDTSREARLLLDIATTRRVSTGRVASVVLVDGLSGEEAELEKKFEKIDYFTTEGGGWTEKSMRESVFPVEVLRSGLKVDIFESSASMAEDKRHILNSIAGRPAEELDQEPHKDSKEYDLVNDTLSGIFAAPGFRAAIQCDADIEEFTSALRRHSGRRELTMSFQGMGAWFGDKSVKSLNKKHVDALGKAFTGLQSLTHLDLKFTEGDSTGRFFCFPEFIGNIGKASNLEHIDMVFPELWSLENFGAGFGQLKKLLSLKLSMRHCCIDDVDGLVGLEGCTALQRLELDFQRSKGWKVEDHGQVANADHNFELREPEEEEESKGRAAKPEAKRAAAAARQQPKQCCA